MEAYIWEKGGIIEWIFLFTDYLRVVSWVGGPINSSLWCIKITSLTYVWFKYQFHTISSYYNLCSVIFTKKLFSFCQMLACLIHGWVSTKTWRRVDPYITDSWLILIPPTVSRSIRQLSPWASLSGLLVDTWPILDRYIDRYSIKYRLILESIGRCIDWYINWFISQYIGQGPP